MSIKTDLYFLLGTALLISLTVLAPVILEGSYVFFIVVVLLLGIPHGAIDHLIFFENQKVSKQRSFQFVLTYLLLMALVGVLWFIVPTLSFFLFLLISAFHFGQSQIYFLKSTPLLNILFYTLWGVFLLAAIIYFNYAECIGIFSSLEALRIGPWFSERFLIVLLIVSGFSIISLLAHAFHHKKISALRLGIEVLFLSGVLLLSATTNAIFAFTVYFGFWHSMKSLIMEFKYLRRSYTLKSFLKNLIPFSLIAILFLFISHEINLSTIQMSPYLLFIIIISTLTVPHLFIMKDLYKSAQAEA